MAQLYSTTTLRISASSRRDCHFETLWLFRQQFSNKQPMDSFVLSRVNSTDSSVTTSRHRPFAQFCGKRSFDLIHSLAAKVGSLFHGRGVLDATQILDNRLQVDKIFVLVIVVFVLHHFVQFFLFCFGCCFVFSVLGLYMNVCRLY